MSAGTKGVEAYIEGARSSIHEIAESMDRAIMNYREKVLDVEYGSGRNISKTEKVDRYQDSLNALLREAEECRDQAMHLLDALQVSSVVQVLAEPKSLGSTIKNISQEMAPYENRLKNIKAQLTPKLSKDAFDQFTAVSMKKSESTSVIEQRTTPKVEVKQRSISNPELKSGTAAKKVSEMNDKERQQWLEARQANSQQKPSPEIRQRVHERIEKAQKRAEQITRREELKARIQAVKESRGNEANARPLKEKPESRGNNTNANTLKEKLRALKERNNPVTPSPSKSPGRPG